MKKISFILNVILLFCSLSVADAYITIPVEKDGGHGNNNLVSILAEGNGALWVGTESGIVFRAFKNKNKWEMYKEVLIDNEKIISLLWADTILLIGTDRGFYPYTPQKGGNQKLAPKKRIDMNSSVLNIYKFKAEFWFVTKNSVFKAASFKKDQLHELQFTSKNKINIHSSFAGFDRIYIETDNGLFVLPIDSQNPSRIVKSNALNGVRLITGSFRVSEMWFGTSYGLFSYNSVDSLWNRYSIDTELPDAVILSSLWFGQYLWMGTMRGPICFNSETSQCMQVSIPDSLKDVPVNIMINYANSIIMGISGKGLFEKELPDIPIVSINNLELKNDTIKIHGTMSGNKIKSLKFFYSPNISPVLNLTEGFSITKQAEKSDVLGVWNIKEINEGDYIIGAKIETESGKSNIIEYPVSVKRQKIELMLDPFPEYTRTDTFPVSGICSNNFKPLIKLSPNGSEIHFQNETMGFMGTVTLVEGVNKVVVKMFDPKNGSALAQVTRNIVLDKIPPKLGIDKIFSVRDPVVNVKGTFSDANPDRIEIYTVSDTFRCNPQVTAFSQILKVKYGITLLRLVAFDKAGNRSEAQSTIVYDTVPPGFAFVECPAYTKLKDVTISGFFTEINVESVHILPFNTKADIDMTSAKFTCKISLHEGPNAIECVIKDLAGMTTSEKIWITADYTPPVFYFDSIPQKSNRERIKISGSVKDKFFATLKVSNPNILVDCNLQENKFDFDWLLDIGLNTLIVSAIDLAGNQSMDTLMVLYSGMEKGADTVKTYNEMRGMVAKLEQENASLKQRIVNCEQSAKNESNSSDLNKNRYIIYKIKKDETLYYLSQKFYGKMNLYWKIAEFNNLKEKDDLVPGKEIKIPIIDEEQSRNGVTDSVKGKFDNIHTSVGHIRVSPNNNAALAGVLIKGDPVEVLEKKDDWFRIQTNQGVTGWIQKDILGK